MLVCVHASAHARHLLLDLAGIEAPHTPASASAKAGGSQSDLAHHFTPQNPTAGSFDDDVSHYSDQHLNRVSSSGGRSSGGMRGASSCGARSGDCDGNWINMLMCDMCVYLYLARVLLPCAGRCHSRLILGPPVGFEPDPVLFLVPFLPPSLSPARPPFHALLAS